LGGARFGRLSASALLTLKSEHNMGAQKISQIVAKISYHIRVFKKYCPSLVLWQTTKTNQVYLNISKDTFTLMTIFGWNGGCSTQGWISWHTGDERTGNH
jgi:hypothetical protein